MKVNPTTNIENIVLFKNWRISVLKKGIIRLEKSLNNTFNDAPTQQVINRNFRSVNFTTNFKDDYLVIELANYSLFFNGNIDESYILYKEKKIALNNECNLGGTYETVDGMDGEIQTIKGVNYQIGLGICATNGLAILDDSNSYCFDDDLNFSHLNPDEMDIYIFFYPNNYQKAVKDFFEIAGYPPKLPKYVFGNWWSRFYAYTQEKYLYLMDSFEYENVPFTVATVDMDWHYSPSNGRNVIRDIELPESEFIKDSNSTTQKYYPFAWNDQNEWSKGWTGYTWNKQLFKDYEQFLRDLKTRGLHVTLNLHPADGIAFYEEMYERCAKRIGFDYTSKESIPFDLTDEENKKMFFEEVLNYYEEKGVDFWWIDWQQGAFSKFPGLTPMWLCNHYFYIDRAKHTNRPLILSRCCGAGGHRYPLGFSGDSFETFASLKYLVKTTSQATNIGFTYWSHDIGGHMHGIKDGDLNLKFIQFGVFSPILRIHSSCNEVFSKEMKLYLNGYGELMNKWLRLRHQMIPYLYSFSLKTTLDGQGLIEPLYYHHPKDKKAFLYKDSEYYFANDLLVAPYTDRKDINDLNCREVYFPEGTFYDLKYGYEYQGKKVYEITRETGDMPLFIKKGAFFVVDYRNNGNEINNPKHLGIATSMGNGEYVFYEDDEKDKVLQTIFANNAENNKGEITIKFKGAKKLHQKDRKYTFRILNVYEVADVQVSNANIESIHTEGGFLEITIKDLDFNSVVTVVYEAKNNTETKLAIRHTTTRLMYVDDVNDLRNELYEQLVIAQSRAEVIAAIKNSKLKDISKKELLEVA